MGNKISPDQCHLRAEASVPRSKIVELAEQAHRAGMTFEDYFRQQIERILKPLGATVEATHVEPRPFVVTKAADDYAELCAFGAACHPTSSSFADAARQGEGIKKVPAVPPGSFKVVVDR
ncbi:MAG: hypothetical protein PHS73_02580 [Candidatus Peribacteraceae bacterium]|nr:hypothetical protein [Candidatus Peribacteraceae bacterium]